MRNHFKALFGIVVALASSAPHAETVTIGRMEITDDHVMNPMEFRLDALTYQAPSMYICYGGYINTKAGAHDKAIDLHQRCADAGFTRSMIWLAYIYQNGLVEGGENPELSAYWDLQAAQAGDEVGMFNYGLDLMRGYGVAKDERLAREWIDLAARGGHKHSRELIAAGYDVDAVTPDADEGRWAQFQ